MNVKDYSSYFHDGSIVSIDHAGNKMVVFMESAEVNEEDVKGNNIVSKDDRIRGKLHIEGIKKIKENDQLYLNTLIMKSEDAEIFHFEIDLHNVEFQIKWNSCPPKPCIEDFSTIKIEAEKIWWENLPDLSV